LPRENPRQFEPCVSKVSTTAITRHFGPLKGADVFREVGKGNRKVPKLESLRSSAYLALRHVWSDIKDGYVVVCTVRGGYLHPNLNQVLGKKKKALKKDRKSSKSRSLSVGTQKHRRAFAKVNYNRQAVPMTI